MTGLGWQELVIVAVILCIFLGGALPIYLIFRALRHRSRHDALRQRYRQAGDTASLIYAGFWDRAGAALLDGLVLLVPIWVIQAAGQRLTGEPYSIAASLLTTAVWMAYMIIGNGRGATLGKRWAGLRVVNAAGAAPGLQRASVRVLIPLAASLLTYFSVANPVRIERGEPVVSLQSILPLLASWLIVLVDTLWMIWDPRKQTLHDKLAGTFVIVPW
jgi:uncharacterized RDD family membrane protein YckC